MASPESSPPDCKEAPGTFVPVIDRSRCEGKEECVRVCPYAVFTMGILPNEQRSELGLLARLKGFAHGWRQTFATNADACRACGRCVAACPEKAITLSRA